METLKIDLHSSNHIEKNQKNSYTHGKVFEENHLKLQKKELGNNIKFSYHVDQDTGKIRIKIYDFLTGEVIQEIPSDKFLDFIKEMKKGIDNDALKKLGLIPTGIFIENEV
jgi:uncharacterized FlaG/YvyC family protein